MFIAGKKESLQEGTKVLRRLEAETLPVACFHPYLQKVRGRLKVERKTHLYGKQIKNRLFQGGCPAPLLI